VRDYATPAAFRAAVEARLRERARRLSAPAYIVRRQAALERLVARLSKVAPDRWAIKGGLALESRLGERARVSIDLDADHLHGAEAARAEAAGDRDAPLSREHVEHAELALGQAQQLAIAGLERGPQRLAQLEPWREHLGHVLYESRSDGHRFPDAAVPVIEDPPHTLVDVGQVFGEDHDGRLRVGHERLVGVGRVGKHDAVADLDVEPTDDRVLFELVEQRVVGRARLWPLAILHPLVRAVRSRVFQSVQPSIPTLISIHALAHIHDGSRKSRAIASASECPPSLTNRTRMS